MCGSPSYIWLTGIRRYIMQQWMHNQCSCFSQVSALEQSLPEPDLKGVAPSSSLGSACSRCTFAHVTG